MTQKVVVTGVAGFVGSHLAERLLNEGHDVVGVDCFTDYYDVRIKSRNLADLNQQSRFKFVGGSLNDLDLSELFSGVSVVFHQAAQAGVRASWGDQFDHYVDCNVRATQRVCEAARRASVDRIVYASSSSVYGDTSDLPTREDHALRPVSPYGVTKLDGENLCLLYEKNFGLPVTCLRYFTVFGPRQRPDMAIHRFIRWGLDGTPIDVYGNGEQSRDFTYVDDIVEANVAAMNYTGAQSVFNVGGGNRATINTVLDILGRHIGSLDVRYQERQDGDVFHTWADTTLAQQELGYQPQVGLEEGLVRQVDWVRELTSFLAREQ